MELRPLALIMVGRWSDSIIDHVERQTEVELTCARAHPRALRTAIARQRGTWLLVGDRLSESTVETLVHDAWEIQNDLRLALLGSPDDQLRCQRWVQRGCRIYLSPTVTGERLLRSLTLAEDGFFILDEKFQRNTGVLRPVRESLTARETDVLELLSCGLTNSLIAQELFLSRSTVEFHIKRIFGKLGVSNRTEAAVRARELELGPERPYAAGLTP